MFNDVKHRAATATAELLVFLRVDTAVHGLLRAERRGDGGYCRLRLAPVASRDI